CVLCCVALAFLTSSIVRYLRSKRSLAECLKKRVVYVCVCVCVSVFVCMCVCVCVCVCVCWNREVGYVGDGYEWGGARRLGRVCVCVCMCEVFVWVGEVCVCV